MKVPSLDSGIHSHVDNPNRGVQVEMRNYSILLLDYRGSVGKDTTKRLPYRTICLVVL